MDASVTDAGSSHRDADGPDSETIDLDGGEQNDAVVNDAVVNDGGGVDTIVLDERLAFPSAFGAGSQIPGGREGSIYEVTNLHDSGPGSFRDAISESDRLIIIKVEGLIDTSSIQIREVGRDNITIWGQFAPGNGITISGNRHVFQDSNNHIFRHVTFQNKNALGYAAFSFLTTETAGVHTNPAGHGHYVDHCSFRFGMDQTLDISSRLSNEKSTAAYNLIAEGVEGHNTGGIIGGGSTASRPSGDITFARNMFYNIDHRHPNIGGDGGNIEHYNNYIVNWSARLTRVNGAMNIDWFRNYADNGNHPQSSSAPVNKYFYSASEWHGRTPSIYSADNFIGGWDEMPSAAQPNIWVWYKSSPSGCTSGCDVVGTTRVIDNEPIDASLFTASQQHHFAEPPDGYWDVMDVPERLRATAGHNRGIRADGSPGFFRDDNDARYVERSAARTTEATYPTTSEWRDTSFTDTSMYLDTDGDHMPDWFENQHAHLDPETADGSATHVEWDFGSYVVTNRAGYSNLEICAEFYADGFQSMLHPI